MKKILFALSVLLATFSVQSSIAGLTIKTSNGSNCSGTLTETRYNANYGSDGYINLSYSGGYWIMYNSTRADMLYTAIKDNRNIAAYLTSSTCPTNTPQGYWISDFYLY